MSGTLAERMIGIQAESLVEFEPNRNLRLVNDVTYRARAVMTTYDNDTLGKLNDSGLTVATSDEDIRGRTVKDKDGDDIGKVEDLLIDETHRKVRFMLVESGGFLGIGETKVLIPVDAISRIDGEHVHIDQTREHVARAPRYDPELVNNRTYHENLYGHYGYGPYWGSGYMYPTFPYYAY